MQLTLKHNVTKKEVTIDLVDLADSNLFYHFDEVYLPEGMDDGEYDYTLYSDEGKIVSVGLCQIGDYQNENKQYKEKKEIIQYNG